MATQYRTVTIDWIYLKPQTPDREYRTQDSHYYSPKSDGFIHARPWHAVELTGYGCVYDIAFQPHDIQLAVAELDRQQAAKQAAEMARTGPRPGMVLSGPLAPSAPEAPEAPTEAPPSVPKAPKKKGGEDAGPSVEGPA